MPQCAQRRPQELTGSSGKVSLPGDMDGTLGTEGSFKGGHSGAYYLSETWDPCTCEMPLLVTGDGCGPGINFAAEGQLSQMKAEGRLGSPARARPAWWPHCQLVRLLTAAPR